MNCLSVKSSTVFILFFALIFCFSACEEPDPCESVNCQNGGTCIVDANGLTSCECPPGYYGTLCDNYDPCLLVECQNGGECQIDDFGNSYCECPDGFTGTSCQTPVTTTDPCDNLNCQNGGTCVVDANGNASCDCPDGFTGANCQTPIQNNPCDDVSCQNGGVCLVQNGVAVCECPNGYTGDNCEIDLCADTNCQNGGTCVVDDNGMVSCECPDDYTGDNCETYDPCFGISCPPNSTLEVEDGECLCFCNPGYEGGSCEIEIRAKFLGSFDGYDQCPSGDFPYDATISSDASDVLKMTISNFAAFDIDISAIIVGLYEFEIPSQVDDLGREFAGVDEAGDVILGYYDISDNTVVYTYTVFYSDGTSETCDAVLTPK